MPRITRRSALLAAFAKPALARTQGMQLHLSCGSIGVKGTPREILDWAAAYGFDAIDADPACVAALFPAEMKAKNIRWATAGVPVDFRHDDAKFQAGLSSFPE